MIKPIIDLSARTLEYDTGKQGDSIVDIVTKADKQIIL